MLSILCRASDLVAHRFRNRRTGELAPVHIFEVRDRKDRIVIRQPDGDLWSCTRRCPHGGADLLYTGRLACSGDALTCSRHPEEGPFDLVALDGRLLQMAGDLLLESGRPQAMAFRQHRAIHGDLLKRDEEMPVAVHPTNPEDDRTRSKGLPPPSCFADYSSLNVNVPYCQTVSDARDTFLEVGCAAISAAAWSGMDVRDVVSSVIQGPIVAELGPAAIKEGPGYPQHPWGERSVSNLEYLPVHSDGWEFGDAASDIVVFEMRKPHDIGGQSIILDGRRLAEELSSAEPELWRMLTSPGWQFGDAPGEPSARGPAVDSLPDGRVVVRRSPFMACEGFDEDEVRLWGQLLDAVALGAEGIGLGPGDLLILDNFRCLHSRRPFIGTCELRRTWFWSSTAPAVPASAARLTSVDVVDS